MELLEGEGLRRRMLDGYSRNPKGWSFTVSPSLGSGFYDAVVSGPDGTWMLKIDSMFKPFPTVLGSLAEGGGRPQPGSAFPYGYRRLPPGLVLRLLGGEGPSPEEKMPASLASVLESEPTVPEAGSSYAEGPIVLTMPGTVSLSQNQKEVDARLASEMRRLLKSRYPAYG
ncbi:MAG: hypothetical protein JRM79_00300 [Nitrososphaerota archaeon]|jgi:hypothetical protein|nr:hypothetical protein [Nitrososphaerota archaeon]MCL5672495.1 hypothetical protein [Nitrososphaerota archaeon]MDG6903738.1 hypothetical protein [Nitrososphaerota archaeon]MDG6912166.1 hypothetical protein [Nitrososphaerota archaeon]MDG6919846.1 hypothetical protein [Nitrososphaerota archaeon]